MSSVTNSCLICESSALLELPQLGRAIFVSTDGSFASNKQAQRVYCSACRTIFSLEGEDFRPIDFYKATYDTTAKTQNCLTFVANSGTPRRKYDELIQPLGEVLDSKPRRILDIGCGSGEFTSRVAALYQGAYVEGWDPSVPETQSTNTLNDQGGVTLRRFDINKAVVDEPFDLIICHSVINRVAVTALTRRLPALAARNCTLSLEFVPHEAAIMAPIIVDHTFYYTASTIIALFAEQGFLLIKEKKYSQTLQLIFKRHNADVIFTDTEEEAGFSPADAYRRNCESWYRFIDATTNCFNDDSLFLPNRGMFSAIAAHNLSAFNKGIRISFLGDATRQGRAVFLLTRPAYLGVMLGELERIALPIIFWDWESRSLVTRF